MFATLGASKQLAADRRSFVLSLGLYSLGLYLGLYIGLVEHSIPILGEASPHERHVFKIFVIFFAIIDCSL